MSPTATLRKCLQNELISFHRTTILKRIPCSKFTNTATTTVGRLLPPTEQCDMFSGGTAEKIAETKSTVMFYAHSRLATKTDGEAKQIGHVFFAVKQRIIFEHVSPQNFDIKSRVCFCSLKNPPGRSTKASGTCRREVVDTAALLLSLTLATSLEGGS